MFSTGMKLLGLTVTHCSVSSCVYMVKLNKNKIQVCLMKKGTEGEIFSGSSFSYKFPCVPQQVRLVCESSTFVSVLLRGLREGILCPLAPFPAELIPHAVLTG